MPHDADRRDLSESAEPAAARSGTYVVVARRYRPKTFEDLVGQQQMTTALINAIQTDRVGHAYLFTGARGVGKTSTARIFAKALNAPGGPTPHPDNDSDICQAIDAGEDVDVIEIDGASNRGIDEIRQLRANANVRPSRARYKIYIIDEVHMLTAPAFNALLKTLEEPPPHVKFILCTTDPQKIPVTVLSRCQRYDFAPVSVPAIVDRLQHIVTSEGRAAEPDALRILARRAEGSMRDSQSLLEQLLAYCSGTIGVADVHRMLGTAPSSRLATLTDHLLQRDAPGTLAAVDAAVTEGVDCGQLAEQLLGYMRDLMAVAVGGSAELLRHVEEADFEALREAAARFGVQSILAAFEILDQAVVRMRQSTQPRTLLEIAVIRICHLDDLDDLARLIEQLRHPPGLVATGPTSGGAPRTGEPVSRASSSSGSGPEKKTTGGGNSGLSRAAGPGEPVALCPATADQIWKQAIAELNDMTADFASYFDHIATSAPESLVVHFRAAYTLQKESCQRPDRKAQLEQAVARIVGHPVCVEFALIPEAAPAVVAPPPSMFQLMREKAQHPLVRQAVELFDAEVTRVDMPRTPTAAGGPHLARRSVTDSTESDQ
ncbi:MAG: DNA polymerase III subunit gamma/tau [Pirellulaceae bacterium]|nr:DNA polymerase III subunit gamma/tau [Pirellulaceae bacterium]